MLEKHTSPLVFRMRISEKWPTVSSKNWSFSRKL